MGKKLMEKNGAEMCAALVSIAAPIKRFLDDPEFDAAFKEATKKGLKMGTNDVLKVYADLVPMIFGDKHIKDTMAILSAIEGKSVKALLAMNGADLIADTIAAFNDQLAPFFTRLGISSGAN